MQERYKSGSNSERTIDSKCLVNSSSTAINSSKLALNFSNKFEKEIKKKKMSRIDLMIKASEDVIKKQVQQVMMPRWLSGRVKDIWLMQYHLENYNSKKSKELIANPRFRMAYDFFVLRSQSIDKQLKTKAEYWTNIQK